ncbi:MAG: flagellar basal-body rod protein FlgF [Candidatus Nitrohelix vancouverensis]|uniref:Flagellar basal-body rod protein FlgF n=1 Tax=Candidatus Nitrohelix vancouverensis TaxID=2705534 RepID=A0A7T0G2M7_9BACT|nr:MAG: flagellar basal-body rod protein FlgF [Candidatus Nitrohelix vancouverensis]
MHEGLYIAASAGIKQQGKMDVIANNLANLNNTGFKKDGLVFKEMIPPFDRTNSLETARNVLLPADISNENVAYVGINEFFTDHSQGNLTQTGNTLDLGLDGDGFFKVDTPAGIRYTRNGNFRLDQQSRLVTQEGLPVVAAGGGPVLIDAVGGVISIAKDGTVSVGNGLENAAVAEIELVTIKDKKGLQKDGSGLYQNMSDEAVEEPANGVSIRQGFLELSNVNSVEEMTDMISTMRAFEAYQKVIQAIDGADEQSVNNIGRVG